MAPAPPQPGEPLACSEWGGGRGWRHYGRPSWWASDSWARRRWSSVPAFAITTKAFTGNRSERSRVGSHCSARSLLRSRPVLLRSPPVLRGGPLADGSPARGPRLRRDRIGGDPYDGPTAGRPAISRRPGCDTTCAGCWSTASGWMACPGSETGWMLTSTSWRTWGTSSHLQAVMGPTPPSPASGGGNQTPRRCADKRDWTLKTEASTEFFVGEGRVSQTRDTSRTDCIHELDATATWPCHTTSSLFHGR